MIATASTFLASGALGALLAAAGPALENEQETRMVILPHSDGADPLPYATIVVEQGRDVQYLSTDDEGVAPEIVVGTDELMVLTFEETTFYHPVLGTPAESVGQRIVYDPSPAESADALLLGFFGPAAREVYFDASYAQDDRIGTQWLVMPTETAVYSFQAGAAFFNTPESLAAYFAYHDQFISAFSQGFLLRTDWSADLGADGMILRIDTTGHPYGAAPMVTTALVDGGVGTGSLHAEWMGWEGTGDYGLVRLHGQLDVGDNLVLLSQPGGLTNFPPRAGPPGPITENGVDPGSSAAPAPPSDDPPACIPKEPACKIDCEPPEGGEDCLGGPDKVSTWHAFSKAFKVGTMTCLEPGPDGNKSFCYSVTGTTQGGISVTLGPISFEGGSSKSEGETTCDTIPTKGGKCTQAYVCAHKGETTWEWVECTEVDGEKIPLWQLTKYTRCRNVWLVPSTCPKN